MKHMIFLLCCIFFTSQTVFAWGERGHHMSGYVAAVIAHEHLNAADQKLLGDSFRERPHQMGHLNNIPDISWKDSRRKTVVKFNGPTHYFDAEILLGQPLDKKGQPTTDFSPEYLSKVRNFERDFNKVREMYEGKLNPLPGAVTTDRKNISLYFGVGTSPWRVQELYEKMVEAFQCAKDKPKLDKKDRKDFVSPLKVADKDPIYPFYKCTKSTSRLEDIYSAFVFAGVMGHFVADLAQPYHATMDFDGWVTGQGGIHAYFESYMLHFLDESFLGEVTKEARAARAKNWKLIGPAAGTPNFAVQVMLNLAADSLSQLKTLRDIDRKVALIKESERLPYGSLPAKVEAKRKPYADPKVLKAFKTFARDRLAMSSAVLSGLWMQAWRDGGRPDISDVDLITVPYTLDVPFLWPSYSKDYLK